MVFHVEELLNMHWKNFIAWVNQIDSRWIDLQLFFWLVNHCSLVSQSDSIFKSLLTTINLFLNKKPSEKMNHFLWDFQIRILWKACKDAIIFIETSTYSPRLSEMKAVTLKMNQFLWDFQIGILWKAFEADKNITTRCSTKAIAKWKK